MALLVMTCACRMVEPSGDTWVPSRAQVTMVAGEPEERQVRMKCEEEGTWEGGATVGRARENSHKRKTLMSLTGYSYRCTYEFITC